MPGGEARKRQEEEAREALIEVGVEPEWPMTNKLHSEPVDYKEREELTRSPSTRPPSYVSRAPTMYEDDETLDEEDVAGLPKPRDVKVFDGSCWSGLNLHTSGYESVSGGDEAFEDATRERSLM